METEAAADSAAVVYGNCTRPRGIRLIDNVYAAGMIGTPAQVFPSTHWSVVLAAQADNPAQARDALEALCTVYWYPLYAYLRRCGQDRKSVV